MRAAMRYIAPHTTTKTIPSRTLPPWSRQPASRIAVTNSRHIRSQQRPEDRATPAYCPPHMRFDVKAVTQVKHDPGQSCAPDYCAGNKGTFTLQYVINLKRIRPATLRVNALRRELHSI